MAALGSGSPRSAPNWDMVAGTIVLVVLLVGAIAEYLARGAVDRGISVLATTVAGAMIGGYAGGRAARP